MFPTSSGNPFSMSISWFLNSLILINCEFTLGLWSRKKAFNVQRYLFAATQSKNSLLNFFIYRKWFTKQWDKLEICLLLKLFAIVILMFLSSYWNFLMKLSLNNIFKCSSDAYVVMKIILFGIWANFLNIALRRERARH